MIRSRNPLCRIPLITGGRGTFGFSSDCLRLMVIEDAPLDLVFKSCSTPLMWSLSMCEM